MASVTTPLSMLRPPRGHSSAHSVSKECTSVYVFVHFFVQLARGCPLRAHHCRIESQILECNTRDNQQLPNLIQQGLTFVIDQIYLIILSSVKSFTPGEGKPEPALLTAPVFLQADPTRYTVTCSDTHRVSFM